MCVCTFKLYSILNYNSFSRAKIIPVTLALKTTKYLFEEREYMPWQSVLNNLDYFYLMFTQTDVYELLQVCKILHIYRKKKTYVAELYVYRFQISVNFEFLVGRTTPRSRWPPFLNISRILLKVGHKCPLAIQTSKWSIACNQ